MTVLTQTLPDAGGYVVLWFAEAFNRDTITIAAGQKLRAGAVLGRVTATSKYVAYNKSATDGSQTGAGILFDDVDATAGDTIGVGDVRGPMLVSKDELVWAVGQDSAAQAAGIADLAKLGIIAR